MNIVLTFSSQAQRRNDRGRDQEIKTTKQKAQGPDNPAPEVTYLPAPLAYRPSASQMGHNRNQKQYQENHKKYLGYAGGCHGDSREAENTSDQRHHQEYQCPIKHSLVLQVEVDLANYRERNTRFDIPLKL
jgi:hypothetical protein